MLTKNQTVIAVVTFVGLIIVGAIYMASEHGGLLGEYPSTAFNLFLFLFGGIVVAGAVGFIASIRKRGEDE